MTEVTCLRKFRSANQPIYPYNHRATTYFVHRRICSCIYTAKLLRSFVQRNVYSYDRWKIAHRFAMLMKACATWFPIYLLTCKKLLFDARRMVACCELLRRRMTMIKTLKTKQKNPHIRSLPPWNTLNCPAVDLILSGKQDSYRYSRSAKARD